MTYRDIEGLPTDDQLTALESRELAALADVWHERKGQLEHAGEYQEFLKQLQREWAIETGIIERLYTWDRGVTEVLIEQGIESSLISGKGGIARDEAEHVKKIIDDQLGIVEGLFSFVRGGQPFTEHFIRSIHAKFTAHQDHTDALTPDGEVVSVVLLKGEYKQHPNNPRRPDGDLHEYCPPEFVRDEMERLVHLYQEYEHDVRPEILAAWVHHRFTQIHPFQDGNGRVARAIASLVFLKARLFPLVIRDQDRRKYIEALEEADAGNLESLVRIFAGRQRDVVLSALGIQQQVQQAGHVGQIMASALEVLKNRFQQHQDKVDRVFDVAEHLNRRVQGRLEELVSDLDPELRRVAPQGHDRYYANVKGALNTDNERHYFYHQIVSVAKKYGYYANMRRYRSWVRLCISTDKVFEVVFSIHGHGHGDNGIMVVSALTFQRVPKEDGGTESVDVAPASPDLFQFNYAETEESTLERFNQWLESAIAIALGEWHRTLDAR